MMKSSSPAGISVSGTPSPLSSSLSARRGCKGGTGGESLKVDVHLTARKLLTNPVRPVHGQGGFLQTGSLQQLLSCTPR